MQSKTADLAILFADISGSSRLYETLGDITGRHTVCECLDVMSNVVSRNHGVVIKTIGDEIMCTFPTAEAAATAACEMNRRLDDDITGKAPELEPLSIRIGLHFGSAILEGGDVHGNAVIVAARMASLAKADQIITTQDTVDQLSEEMRIKTRLIDHSPVKGKKDAIDIFELNWQDDVTAMSTDVLEHNQSNSVMRLTYKGNLAVLNEKQPGLVLGRSVGCDMAINESRASRQHVKLECRRGKFFVIDQSTNGTYILPQGGTEVFLRREELPITGSGEISLGCPFSKSPTDVVSYCVEESG